MKKLLGALRVLLIVARGFALMVAITIFFTYMQWPLFNGWAMGHGMFIFMWPMLSAIVWILILKIEKKI
jgi:hypothetical protein